ncbi:hypothetical protein N7478_011995 [Penicillium angulare]|uniref:uncharacterized protein n=1 Tax=Penicillium angulare TaxID=116970 RepID=UPI00253FF09B|nr:uncharacterized protein N7478_011995 [Penicillium angulare]KAJ5261400.1 hypothetical protein N7478_011995 [Penicillium angulare]
MSCFESFSQSYTAIVTTTSAFGNATTVPTGTNTITFTPFADAVNAFQIEYVPMTSTSSSSTPAATSSSTATSSTASESSPSATSTLAASNGTSGNSLSGGAIAGIVVGAVAFVAILLVLAWYWIRRRKTSPTDDTISSNYYGAGTSGTGHSGHQSTSDYTKKPSFPPAELSANEEVATELSSSQIISEKGTR